MVADDRGLEPRLEPLHAFVGRSAVADEVAEAGDVLDAAPIQIGEHGVERFQVAVNVRDHGDLGARAHSSPGRNARASVSRTPLTNRPDSSDP